MAVERIKCAECDNMILPQTAAAYGGRCAPCHQRAHPVRFEITPADEERFRAIDAIRGRMLAGCSAEEFANMRCPVCGGGIDLHVHPRGRMFYVRCRTSTFHMGFHHSTSTAPAWWAVHLDGPGVWLSDAEPGAAPDPAA